MTEPTKRGQFVVVKRGRYQGLVGETTAVGDGDAGVKINAADGSGFFDIFINSKHLELTPVQPGPGDPNWVCSHPRESLVMRGWTQVCTLCGRGRDIG